jgi:ABC-type transporter Mla subunit MlaD
MAKDALWKARLLFAATLCAGALAAAVWYAWSSSHYRTFQIITKDPVHGLIVDSPVELHGVEVGKVARIELAGADTVRILVNVADDAPVSGATVATITSRGLAPRGFSGYVYIALENRGTDPKPLSAAPGERYPRIVSTPSRLDSMDAIAAAAIAKLDDLTALLKPVLDPSTVASLKRALDELQQITDRLVTVLDPKTVDSLTRSLDDLRQVTSTLAANTARIDSLIANADRDSRELRPLVETSNTMVRELNTQVLPQFYRVMSQLESLTRAFNGVAAQLARNPSVLLRGTETPPGPGER